MRNKIFDRDKMEAVAFCKHLQIRKAGHAAVIVCDLADDARGRKTGELSKIDSRFCMSGAREHTVRRLLYHSLGHHPDIAFRFRMALVCPAFREGNPSCFG